MTAAEAADAHPSAPHPNPAGLPLSTYQHDPAVVPVLARLADAACDGAENPHYASVRVDVLAGEMDRPVERSVTQGVLSNALFYTLYPEKIPQAGMTLEPVNGPSLLPIALNDAPTDLRDTWLALAGEVTHPIARARLYDIVFELRLMSNRRHAAEHAARAYLDGVGGSQNIQAQAYGAVRAWTLARKVRSTDLEQEITERMLGMAGDLLDQNEHPYAVIPMLCALITPARGTAAVVDPRVDDLLDRALLAYPQQHVLADLAALMRKRAPGDPARVEAAHRRLIEAMLDDARAATDPMVIRMLFGEAASVARQHHITDLEKIAIAALQAAPELDWVTTSFPVTLPAVFFDAYLPGFTQATSWREALNIWLHTGPPTGSYETNQEMTRQTQQASIIRYIATTMVFHDGDMPARTLSGDAVFARDLARTELQHLNMHGIFLADALHTIATRFGIPPRAELEAFLQTSGGDPTLMTTLATALQLFWVAEYDAAVHLAVPKVEAAVRALLLELNEPVYRTAVGDGTGTFPGLGALLDPLLHNDFDPDWNRFLRTFLLGDGCNLRNLTAHGYTHDMHPVYAAVALRAFAVVALIASPPEVQRDAATVKASLANPTGARPHRTWWQRIAAAVTAARFELRRG